jgi:hypothetical protein
MISAKILLARQNVALTRPPDPQTFWVRKPCIGNPASAPRKGRSMSVHLLPIGGGDRNVRQAPTERVPINTVISHLDAVGCGSSFAPPSLSARAP